MAAFLDVLLRAFSLAAQSLVVGGAVFVIAVLRPWARASAVSPSDAAITTAVSRSRRLIIVAALAVALTQAAALALAVGALAEDSHWPVTEALSTLYVRVGLARLALAVSVAVLGVALRGRERARRTGWTLLSASVGVIVAAAGTSHAVARLEHRAVLLMLDALHQLAAGVWIGGLLFLIITGIRVDRPWMGQILPRFSAVVLTAVAALVVAGTALTVFYVGGVGGLLGTAYGLMVLTKVFVLAALLWLGGTNLRAVRALGLAGPVSLLSVRRYVEVELGLGLTVLLAAASLTSLPPGGDVVTHRATLAEVATRFTPQWPSFTSPRHEDLVVTNPQAPRNDADRAWSEYNHHVAGVVVLAMGLLGVLEHTRLRRWARHWPLLFLPLSVFMVVRTDPDAWPLGPLGLWESMADPEILQHRFFALMIVVFGVFEWLVRTGRFTTPTPAFVFPVLCAVGGGVLLTHSHATLSVKSEFLMEVTHTPLALLGMVVGWGRWLALRLPPPEARLPGRLSPVALALVGVLLLLYRES